MSPHKKIIIHLIAYIFAVSTALRGLVQFHKHSDQSTIIILLVIFFSLLITEPWLSHRSHRYMHIYLGLQTIVVIMLLIIPTTPPIVDYFAILCVTLAMQTMHIFPSRVGFRWIGTFSVVVAILMIHKFGWNLGLPFALIYPMIFIFVGIFMSTTRQAENAREESQKLLIDLQVTHEKLQLYTAQAEELAALEERNRLARDLHDSVTQTIFSMTLNAQAAQMLLEKELFSREELVTQITRLQEQSRGALTEMRSLVYQLRPTVVAEEGLIPALHKHITGLEQRKGLYVDLQVKDDQLPLTIKQQEEIFRIIQEALNNVSKHAQTDHVRVLIKTDSTHFSVIIEDHGNGFDLQEQTHKSGIGLRSMRERVAALDSTIVIESSPQTGTRISVNVPIAKEYS